MYVIRHKATDTYFKNVYSIPGKFQVKLVTLQEAFTFSDRDRADGTMHRWLDPAEFEVREITLVLV